MSNSSSEFTYGFSGIDPDLIFMTCISPKDIGKVSKSYDPEYIPDDIKDKLFVIPLSAKEFAVLGKPSVGAELSMKISLLSEAI